ncbi:MAG: hypothetical protein UHM85_06045 [Acutalibacteraceae bacterium]|nr:hypothetical protein [Acutalibacteraceae bacterium]
MTNENKSKLLIKFIVYYTRPYEAQYQQIQIKRLNIRDDDLDSIGRLFDENQDYVVDFFIDKISRI